MTSSKTPPAPEVPFTLSSSLATPLMRCVAASSKTPWGTAGAQATPSTQVRNLMRASRDRLTKRQQERLREAFTQMRRISVSTSPTAAPSKCARSSTKPHPPKADTWPLVSSSAYQRVPSPKSLAWAGPYASGRTPSWPTSIPAEQATAQQKPSTESSNWADAPPEATPTPPTTNSECSSSQEA